MQEPKLPLQKWISIATDDGSLSVMHPDHQELFHSQSGARWEAQCLYIEKSGLKDSLATGEKPILVLDIGLGLGYNAMVTIECFLQSQNPATLTMISLEKESELIQLLQSGTASWQQNWPQAWLHSCKDLRQSSSTLWHGSVRHTHGTSQLNWIVLAGTAPENFAELEALLTTCQPSQVNFFWQDPFSPLKNPDMWNADWFGKLHKISAHDAQLLTYSVARTVKDSLTHAAWNWELIKAARKKRHWLKASPIRSSTNEI